MLTLITLCVNIVFIKESETMKTKSIGARINEELYTLLLAYADEHSWTKSFALSKILEHFFCKENRVS